MKQNIIIALLSVICAILGYIAAQISNDAEKQQQTQIAASSTVSTTTTTTPPIQQTTTVNSDKIIDGGTISRPAPEYPAQSAENGEEGTVKIEIVVETNGTVSSARVAKSSGYVRLDNAALRAFKNETYTPINNMRTKYIVRTIFSLT